ncbi:hypothetical protein LJG11_26680 [Pseudomonas aeruginosa]|uniref:hypothetical protein n=1 Tax=Pseudomonas aeruginosa TaxID=287 RepID=UPI001D0B88DD|nr:hypothetical protein [Pseudomonas aeruginosa]MCC0233677.1 hypothetical protein [Pseudomonas aeruginosa]
MTLFHIDGTTLNFSASQIEGLKTSPLYISQEDSHAKALTRLLIGGCAIDGKHGKTIQPNNYLAIGSPKSSIFPSRELAKAFSDLGTEKAGKKYNVGVIKSVCEHLNSQRNNHSLFYPVLNEISKSFYNHNIGRHMSGFVHAYRAFESMSYSFPLFYCRYNNSYTKVYSSLRDFFKGGELDFCSNFYKSLIKDDSLDFLKYKINFRGLYAEELANYLERKLNWPVKGQSEPVLIRTSPSEIETSYIYLFDLIINSRNAYFHHLSGSSSSASSTDIKDHEDYFAELNEVAYQVIGYLLSRLIKVQI